MKKTAVVVILIGVVLAFIGESRPVINKVHSEEAHHNPQLQVEYVKDDPTGWAVAQIGLGLGGLIAAIGLGLFVREVPNITDNQTIQAASYLGAVLAILGALVHAIASYYGVVQAPEEILNDFNTPSWMYPTYTLFTFLAIIIIGYILFQTGYSKKLGGVMIVLSVIFMIIMGIQGPPGVYNFPFLIMGLTLLFKRSPSPELSPQTA